MHRFACTVAVATGLLLPGVVASRASALTGPAAGAPLLRQAVTASGDIEQVVVRRRTVVNPGRGVARSRTVVRPGVRPYRPVVAPRPWVRPGHYWWRPGAAVAAGAAIGFVGAATASAWAGAAPGPGYCWYYTDPSRRQGF